MNKIKNKKCPILQARFDSQAWMLGFWTLDPSAMKYFSTKLRWPFYKRQIKLWIFKPLSGKCSSSSKGNRRSEIGTSVVAKPKCVLRAMPLFVFLNLWLQFDCFEFVSNTQLTVFKLLVLTNLNCFLIMYFITIRFHCTPAIIKTRIWTSLKRAHSFLQF